MFKQIAKSCLSVLGAKKSPEVNDTKLPSTATKAKKDDLVVDMMSAIF